MPIYDMRTGKMIAMPPPRGNLTLTLDKDGNRVINTNIFVELKEQTPMDDWPIPEELKDLKIREVRQKLVDGVFSKSKDSEDSGVAVKK